MMRLSSLEESGRPSCSQSVRVPDERSTGWTRGRARRHEARACAAQCVSGSECSSFSFDNSRARVPFHVLRAGEVVNAGIRSARGEASCLSRFFRVVSDSREIVR